jgi:hypothetical protein
MMNNSSPNNNNYGSHEEDRSIYCKYCLEYYYAKHQNDIVEHTTSMNHLMNISRNRHNNNNNKKGTIDLQRKNVDNNERQQPKIKIKKSNIGYKMLVSAGWNEKSALGKKNRDKEMNEPISVTLKNNRQGIGHTNSSNDRTIGALTGNNNDNNNNNTTIISDVKQNKNNDDDSTNNANTKKKKNVVKVRQEKMREKRIRMELYSKNAVSDEHIDLLLSTDGYESDTKRGRKKRKKKRYGW